MFRAGSSILKPWRNNGSSPVTQSSPFLARILALPPLALSSSSLEAWVGQIPNQRPRARFGAVVAHGCQPSPRSGAGTPGRPVGAPTDKRPRQGLQAFPLPATAPHPALHCMASC